MVYQQNNNRVRKTAALLALGLALPAVAQAYSTGFYLGAGGGSARDREIQNNLTVAPGSATSTDARRNAWKAFGGVDIGSGFGIEAGFVSLGTATATNGLETVGVTDRGPYLDAVLRVPITPQFGLFAKGGVDYIRSEVNDSLTGFSASRRTRGTYGAGVKLDFTPNWGIRGEWERFGIQNNKTDLVSASLVYAFR